jgi:hypothetical protein
MTTRYLKRIKLQHPIGTRTYVRIRAAVAPALRGQVHALREWAGFENVGIGESFPLLIEAVTDLTAAEVGELASADLLAIGNALKALRGEMGGKGRGKRG